MQYYKPKLPPPPVEVGVLRDTLGRHPSFGTLIALLDERIGNARELYEGQPANEFRRGEIAGIKLIKDLLTNQA